ncbi:MAG TPA: glycoside hydrolase family 66 protein [Cellulomonas sp.]
MSVRPTRSTYAPCEDVTVRVGAAPVGSMLTIRGVAGIAAELAVDGPEVAVGALPIGGYGVDLWGPDGALLASSAFDVLTDPLDRPRYGFVAHYGPDVDVAALQAHAVRMHLNAVQHYDWAHSYTELVAPDGCDEYTDSLGNRVSVAVLRAMLAAFREIGAAPLGYAAVYGVPADQWDTWGDVGLYRSTGQPYGFGDDFLNVVDPGAPRWRRQIVGAIRRSYEEIGFAGFHLDQYGWPKRALRADGSETDLSQTLPALVDQIAGAVPDARLIFNNVNGFPLDRAARVRQSALYTEVWPPRVELRDLVDLVAQSRGLSPLPVIVAAYMEVFHDVGGRAARDAARLTMATIFSSGATHLFTGEDGRLLVHPYYVRSEAADDETLDLLERWYTFLVRHGDLLVYPAVVDVTAAYFGEYNADVVVEAPSGVRVSIHPEPGVVWARVMRTDHGLVVHLVNLTGQDETGWDTPKRPIEPVRGLVLRLRQVGREPVAVRWLDPEIPGPGDRLEAVADDIDQVTQLPALGAWAAVHVPTDQEWR